MLMDGYTTSDKKIFVFKLICIIIRNDTTHTFQLFYQFNKDWNHTLLTKNAFLCQSAWHGMTPGQFATQFSMTLFT